MTAAPAAPKVVAMVPAWKAAAFIERTLDGLAAQRHPNLEVLVSDDASPDATADICDRYAARDRRFRVIRQRANLGWVGNVNALLNEAKGDYLMIAYHDDLSAPDYIARMVAVLEGNPRAIIAFSDLAMVDDDGRREVVSYPVLDGVASRRARAAAVARLEGLWWVPCRGMFRAAAAREIGGLRRNLAGEFSADWPWMLHMSLLGECVRVPEPLHTKFYRRGRVASHAASEDSPARAWTFSAWSWTAASLSAMRAVWRARIPPVEKAAVTWVLCGFVWRQVRQAVAGAISAWWRRRRRGRSIPVRD